MQAEMSVKLKHEWSYRMLEEALIRIRENKII